MVFFVMLEVGNY